MSDADVVYSDVKFLKSKENAPGTAFSPAETTYSEVKILKTKQSTEFPGSQQQAVTDGGSKVTTERVAIAVLSTFLVAAIGALVFTSYEIIQTMERLQQLTVVNKNLSERRCEVKKWITVPITCPQPPTKPCMKCQDGWEEDGKQCYFFSSDSSPWEEARDECQGRGGNLVQIDSTAEQYFLVQTLGVKMNEPEDKFWIGLTDTSEEGTWLWVNGSPLNKSLTFWSGDQPDDWNVENPNGEDCVRMGEKDRSADPRVWFDKSCEVPHRRICEKTMETGHLKCV